jgi:hypothetical protein
MQTPLLLNDGDTLLLNDGDEFHIIFLDAATPAERVYTIAAESRVYLIPLESRVLQVPRERRIDQVD